MLKIILLVSALFAQTAIAQPKVQNLGDKVCALWTYHIDQDKRDSTRTELTSIMDWWSLGYLKGMSAQYTFTSKQPNPLLKLRGDEAVDWMRAYCRVNAKESISDAALALLLDLQERP